MSHINLPIYFNVVLLSYSTSMPKPSWPRRKPTSSAALWPKLLDHSSWQVGTGWKLRQIPVKLVKSSESSGRGAAFSVHEMRMRCEFLYEILMQGSPRLPERADPFRALVWASWLKPYSRSAVDVDFQEISNQINHLLNTLEKKHPYFIIFHHISS